MGQASVFFFTTFQKFAHFISIDFLKKVIFLKLIPGSYPSILEHVSLAETSDANRVGQTLVTHAHVSRMTEYAEANFLKLL